MQESSSTAQQEPYNIKIKGVIRTHHVGLSIRCAILLTLPRSDLVPLQIAVAEAMHIKAHWRLKLGFLGAPADTHMTRGTQMNHLDLAVPCTLRGVACYGTTT